MKNYQAIIEKIDELLERQPQVLVAIDGDCGGGKTTLAGYLKQLYDCNVLPMDYFFLSPEQKTVERLNQPGGNVDYERFLTEVLTPLRAGQAFTYRPYDCATGNFGAEIEVPERKLSIVEGVYSLHPALADAYHIKVFIGVTPDLQLQRIIERDGAEMLERFHEEWIPLEKHYLAYFNIEGRCDFVFREG